MIRRDLLTAVVFFLSSCGQRIAGISARKEECKLKALNIARDGECVASDGNLLGEGGGPAADVTPAKTQEPANSKPALSQDLKGLKGALDVGHGLDGDGFDSGAVSHGLQEYALNSKEAALIATHLQARGAQVSVFDYTKDGKSPKLDTRARGARAAGHQIFVSVHHNAAETSAQGTEVLYLPEGTSKDRRLANSIQEKMIQHLWNGDKTKDRKAKVQRLGVLGGVPEAVECCCLTEAFFISDSSLSSAGAEQWVKKAAQAIADGIAQYWLTRNNALSLMGEFFNEGPFIESPDPEGLYKNH